MSGRFVLVASYPKSGNTWSRIVLQRLARGAGRPFALNDLDARYHGILRRFAFDACMPVNAADLLPEEIDCLLPALCRELARQLEGTVFLKVHDAAKRNRAGEWLYPPDCAGEVIYLVRHPFDVAVSTAHHMNISPESAVSLLADDGGMRAPYTTLLQSLPQIFGSWSANVESWLENTSYRVTWARYEDMCADPVRHFMRLAAAAGLNAARSETAAAVEAASFQKLEAEEERAGFRERPHTSPKFFRRGGSATWKGVLDQALCEQLVHDHGPMMERLGYRADGGVDDEARPQ